MFDFGLTKYEKKANVKGSLWAAGFQDDLNKDVSITTALCLNLDWQNMKKQWQMVQAPSELLVSEMISIKMYQSLPPYVWIWIEKIWKTMAMGRGSFWAAGFQDDLNKDKYQSLPPYVWIWIDKIWKKWQRSKAPSELLVSKMISIKMYQSLPPSVWIWIDKIWKSGKW